MSSIEFPDCLNVKYNSAEIFIEFSANGTTEFSEKKS
jgi:hypothetical protein